MRGAEQHGGDTGHGQLEQHTAVEPGAGTVDDAALQQLERHAAAALARLVQGERVAQHAALVARGQPDLVHRFLPPGGKGTQQAQRTDAPPVIGDVVGGEVEVAVLAGHGVGLGCAAIVRTSCSGTPDSKLAEADTARP